jgi:hypothetical protein
MGRASSTEQMTKESQENKTSVKLIYPGNKFDFENIVWIKEKHIKVKLISVEVLEKKRIKATMTIENLDKAMTCVYRLASPEKDCYITTAKGELFPMVSSEDISSEKTKNLPFGIPLGFSLIFSDYSSTSNKINIAVRIEAKWSGQYSYEKRQNTYDITFKDIELK